MAPIDPEARAAYLAEIRREIAEGTYDNPERLSAAVDRLLERLEREVDPETA